MHATTLTANSLSPFQWCHDHELFPAFQTNWISANVVHAAVQSHHRGFPGGYSSATKYHANTHTHTLDTYIVDTQTHCFSGHFPGQPRLASCLLHSQSPIILIPSILTGHAETLHAYRVLRVVSTYPLTLNCHDNISRVLKQNFGVSALPIALTTASKHCRHTQACHMFFSVSVWSEIVRLVCLLSVNIHEEIVVPLHAVWAAGTKCLW